MKKILLIALILASAAAFAQTTTFTGTLSDLTGTPVTSGQVTFDLKPSTDSTISGVARFTPQTVTCGIDGTGALKNQALSGACTVMNNTSLSPAGTYYKVTVCPQFACGASFNAYALGSTTDITTIVPTPGTSPANQFLDLISTQTITGAKNFSNAGNSFSGSFAGTIAATSVTSSSTISSVGNATIGGTITAGSAGHVITTAAGLLDLAQSTGTIDVGTRTTGNLDVSSRATGTLAIANGGTGQTSLIDGPNMKSRAVNVCTTAASANATCDLTVTWTTPFPVGSYNTLCTAEGLNAPAFVQQIVTWTTTGAVVRIQNAPGSSAAVSAGFVFCNAFHD